MNAYIYFGGSFNPLHDGHIQAANEVHQRLSPTALYLMPCAKNPLKRATTQPTHHADIEARLVPYPHLKLTNIQTEPYTYDAVRALRRKHGAASLTLMFGSDIISTLNRFHRWQDILMYAHMLFVPRDGKPWHALLEQSDMTDWFARRQTKPAELAKTTHGHTAYLPIDYHAQSSTDMRNSRDLQKTRTPRTSA